MQYKGLCFLLFLLSGPFQVRLPFFAPVPTSLGEDPLPNGRSVPEGLRPSPFSAYPVPPYATLPPWSMPSPPSCNNPILEPIPMLHTCMLHMHEDLSLTPLGICGTSHLPVFCLQSWKHRSWHPPSPKPQRGDGASRGTGGWQPPCISLGSYSP